MKAWICQERQSDCSISLFYSHWFWCLKNLYSHILGLESSTIKYLSKTVISWSFSFMMSHASCPKVRWSSLIILWFAGTDLALLLFSQSWLLFWSLEFLISWLLRNLFKLLISSSLSVRKKLFCLLSSILKGFWMPEKGELSSSFSKLFTSSLMYHRAASKMSMSDCSCSFIGWRTHFCFPHCYHYGWTRYSILGLRMNYERYILFSHLP